MKLFKNRFIAHRGLHKNKIIPENSMLAFKAAIEKNYAIEFDINITKDNQIVVFHDDDLNRLCNKKEVFPFAERPLFKVVVYTLCLHKSLSCSYFYSTTHYSAAAEIYLAWLKHLRFFVGQL